MRLIEKTVVFSQFICGNVSFYSIYILKPLKVNGRRGEHREATKFSAKDNYTGDSFPKNDLILTIKPATYKAVLRH